MPADYDVDSARPLSQGPGLLTAMRRNPLWVVAAVIVAAALGAIVTLLLPTKYNADAQVVLGDQNDASVFRTVPILNATAKAQNAVQIMRSQAVYDRASEILGGRLSPSEVEKSVSVAPGDAGNPLVTVSATRGSAALTRDLANAEGQAYLDVTKSQAEARSKEAIAALTAPKKQMQSRLASINDEAAKRTSAIQKKASSITTPADRARFVQSSLNADPDYQRLRNQASNITANITAIDQQLQETRVDASLGAQGVDRLYQASTPSDPTSPNLRRNVGIAAALGLLIGAALAWRRLERTRGVAPEQIAATLGAPLLATVTRDRELRNPTKVIDMSPGRQLPDDLRGLASSLMLHIRRRALSGIVITSAATREGKTLIALNLAAAASSAGHDVVLVDGDIRNPALTKGLGMDGDPGLLDMLTGARLTGGFNQHVFAPNQALPVIPIGTRIGKNDTPVFELPAIRHSSGITPAAIIDSPATVEASVALELAARSAGLLVIVANTTTIDDLRTLRSRADLAGAPILGFIVNDHRPSRRQGTEKPTRGHRHRERVTSLAVDPAAVPSH